MIKLKDSLLSGASSYFRRYYVAKKVGEDTNVDDSVGLIVSLCSIFNSLIELKIFLTGEKEMKRSRTSTITNVRIPLEEPESFNSISFLIVLLVTFILSYGFLSLMGWFISGAPHGYLGVFIFLCSLTIAIAVPRYVSQRTRKKKR